MIGDALEKNNPMTLKHAAITATVVMLISLFTVFLPVHGYDIMLQDTQRFCYDLIIFCCTSFITTFGSLTGLATYARHKDET